MPLPLRLEDLTESTTLFSTDRSLDVIKTVAKGTQRKGIVEQSRYLGSKLFISISIIKLGSAGVAPGICVDE